MRLASESDDWETQREFHTYTEEYYGQVYYYDCGLFGLGGVSRWRLWLR